MHSCRFDQEAVLKLPYEGPTSRRIYIVYHDDEDKSGDQIFIQRRDAFSTNLISVLERLRNKEISEIRFSAGLDGVVRIFTEVGGELVGEYSSRSASSLQNFKKMMGLEKRTTCDRP